MHLYSNFGSFSSFNSMVFYLHSISYIYLSPFLKPGEIFYMMFVYGAATAIFLVLGLWYYIGMRMFQEAAIPIQKYILASIILGFLGTAFLAIDLLFWNINGIRSNVVMYIGKVFLTW